MSKEIVKLKSKKIAQFMVRRVGNGYQGAETPQRIMRWLLAWVEIFESLLVIVTFTLYQKDTALNIWFRYQYFLCRAIKTLGER